MKTLCNLIFAFLLSAATTMQAELPTKKVLTLGLAKTLVAAELVGDGRAFEIPASNRFYKKLNDHIAARLPKKRSLTL